MKVTLNKKSGFSLVEMLVVIAVIGIIAAIAVPMIGNITSSAEANRDRRNAQNVASVYASAVAAGYTGNTTAPEAYAKIAAGVTGTGEFATTAFRVPNLPPFDAASGPGKHLSMTDGVLEYQK